MHQLTDTQRGACITTHTLLSIRHACFARLGLRAAAGGADVSRTRRGDWVRSKILLAILALLPATPSLAVEGDTLRPYVEAVLAHDSNLFRFADDAEARASSLGEPIRSVVFRRYGAGVNVDWKQSRQRIVGRLGANQTRFSRYARLLDYSGHDLRGEWQWQLGNRWSGLLLAARDAAQQPYTDRSTGVIRNNLRTDQTLAVQAEYWFHTDWRARARFDDFSRDYDDRAQRADNHRRRTLTLGLYTQGNTIERLGLEYLNARREFPDRAVTPNTDNESDEHVLRVVANWAPSGKTSLYGHLGYARRDQPNLAGRGFEGLQWRLGVRWLPSGKTLLEGVVQRDLGESEDPGVNFRRIDAATLNASWLALPKTRLAARVRYARDVYDGSARKDDILGTTLSATYEVWRGGEISAGWEHSRRDSSFSSQEYRADTLFVSANLQF